MGRSTREHSIGTVCCRDRLLSGTVLPVAIGLGVAIGGFAATAATAPARADAPASIAAMRDSVAGNPAAISPAATPLQLAACNPCNPCAAACGACNPCNPCAAACGACNPCAAACGACNPCSPCAAACGACNPCNPCGAGGGATSSACVVPRLAAANPCNPCAAANPCNPCGACNPCNPCGAANPCNPCGAANPCNPCGASNPCAAANPCNPCAAANPCNPCGACNPCNPCGAGGGAEITDAEAAAAYDCVVEELQAAYAQSAYPSTDGYTGWDIFNTVPYVSATHGGRYVNNYANDVAAGPYGQWEDVASMPVGSILAKDSFQVGAGGHIAYGPLFLMQKMPAGFNADSGDWRYTMVMPNGAVFGVTGGANSAGMDFCWECHMAVGGDADSMTFLPEEYRK